ncbi:MAG: LuxR C-terminal-related transcriptional regulator, partial [Actinobacteria bacterium]|nr:LuxR C-terminal-related transcriptional regulator [Actinomycetota bacterium]
VHAGHARMERLTALSDKGAKRLLVQQLARPAADDVLEKALALCAGNPLLLEQVARSVSQGEELRWASDGVADAAERHLLLGRFAGLQAAGLRWAQAASVLGTRFRPDVVAEVAGLGEETASAVEALWRSGLVRDVGIGFAEFAHPLFGQAVYEDVPAPLRAELHRRSFDVLLARGLEAAAAEHAPRANLVGDQRAVKVLTNAAHDAHRSGALNAATRHLKTAVQLSGDHPDPELMLSLARALLAQGRFPDCAKVADSLLARCDLTALTRSAALRLSGRAQWASRGPLSAASRYAAAAQLSGTDAAETVAETQLDLAFVVWLSHGPRAALTQIDGARGQIPATATWLRSRADVLSGVCGLHAGDVAGFEAATTAARGILRGDGPTAVSPERRAALFGTMAVFALATAWNGCPDEAAATLDWADRARAGMEHDAASPTDQARAVLTYARAVLLRRTGQFGAALAMVEEAVTQAELIPALEPYARSEECYLLFELDGLEASELSLAAAERAAEAADAWWPRLECAHLRGLHLLEAGRSTEASDTYRHAEALARAAEMGEPCAVPFASLAVIAHLQAGRPDDAHRVTEWLEAAAARLPCPWTRLAADQARAAVAEQAGSRSEVEAHYRAAFASLADTDWPIERARLLLAYGCFLRRSARPTAARAALQEGLRLAERLGAARLARSVHQELSAAGGRRRRPHEAPGALTTQEERIARLAATGATTQEIAQQLFLSPTTVKSHLQHVFRKLGIKSRRELIIDPPCGGC